MISILLNTKNRKTNSIGVIAGMKAKTLDTKKEVKINAIFNNSNISTCLVAPKSKDREEYSQRVFKTNTLNLMVCYE